MLMIDYKELGWQYWFITACLLSVGLAGYEDFFLYAICFTVFQMIHFAILQRSVISFPVQVRFFYLILLLIAYPKQFNMIYWLPTIGTWVRLIFGYCTMARCVSLLPWNRKQPFSSSLLMRTFLSRPVRGNILQGFSASK